MNILIADSGATKCEWCLVHNGRRKKINTQGISPYFLDSAGIVRLLQAELLPALKNIQVDEVWYYGTGCNNPDNRKMVQQAIKKILPKASVHVTHDVMGAALALCGDGKGVVCILGTGSSSCYFDGKK